MTSNEPVYREDVSWKKLQGDVLRTPAFPAIFAVLMGTSVQVLFCIYIFIGLNVLGFINPFSRQLFLVQAFFVLAMAGWINGYITARVLKFFGASDW